MTFKSYNSCNLKDRVKQNNRCTTVKTRVLKPVVLLAVIQRGLHNISWLKVNGHKIGLQQSPSCVAISSWYNTNAHLTLLQTITRLTYCSIQSFSTQLRATYPIRSLFSRFDTYFSLQSQDYAGGKPPYAVESSIIAILSITITSVVTKQFPSLVLHKQPQERSSPSSPPQALRRLKKLQIHVTSFPS